MFSALEFEVLLNGFEKVKLNSNAKFVLFCKILIISLRFSSNGGK